MERQVFNRHDMLVITANAAKRIASELLSYHKITPTRVNREEWFQQLLGGSIPCIVRRDEKIKQENNDKVAVGISLPIKADGNRLRYGSWINKTEIVNLISPFSVIQLPFEPTSKSLYVLRELIHKWCLDKTNFGIWGSNALQIITGLNYTDDSSDLDIIVHAVPQNELFKLSQLIEDLETKFLCRIDVEVNFLGQYGVNLKEYFQTDRKYILGKSLYDVNLLNKLDLHS